jgi:hypothetical protein
MDDKALPPENDENAVLQKSTSGDADKIVKPTRGRPKKNKSTTASVWSIKGIEHETRSKISTAAKRSGETIGAYVNRVLLEAANADLASKSQRKEVGPTQDELNATMLKNISDLSRKIEELGNAKPGMLKRLFGA